VNGLCEYAEEGEKDRFNKYEYINTSRETGRIAEGNLKGWYPL
jgi:hypothetical protein